MDWYPSYGIPICMEAHDTSLPMAVCDSGTLLNGKGANEANATNMLTLGSLGCATGDGSDPGSDAIEEIRVGTGYSEDNLHAGRAASVQVQAVCQPPDIATAQAVQYVSVRQGGGTSGSGWWGGVGMPAGVCLRRRGHGLCAG